MRTMKFTMRPERNQGMEMEITTEVVVDGEEEAFEAGKESNVLIMAFLNGFGDEDESGED